MTDQPLAERETLSLREIDSRLTMLAGVVTDYKAGDDTGISVLDALELIDELLDLRYWQTTHTPAFAE